jgi:hypothetical protein
MECGGCTLCCKLLELHEIPSDRGVWCSECDPKKGCKIYTVRPDECKQFRCMWLQMENVGIELRPDKSHVIFSKMSDEVICGDHDPDYEVNKRVKGQIRSFNKQGFSVGMIRGKEKIIYLSKGHKFKEVAKVIDDRAKLYRRLN